MQTGHPSLLKVSTVALALTMIAGFGLPMQGQQAPTVTVGGHRITGAPEDWSHHRLVYSDPGTADEAIKKGTYDKWSKIVNDPRYVLQQVKKGLPVRGPAAGDVDYRNAYANWMKQARWNHSSGVKGNTEKTDWAVSLGPTAGVAQGMIPAKYTFDVNAAPSCTNDFAVYPVNATTGNTRAHVVGTVSTAVGFTGSGTVTLTVTPNGGSATSLVLTASTTLNTGSNYQVFAAASVANGTTTATNLAAAINRNLSSTLDGEVAAVSATNTVTVYALTPGSLEVLTDAETVNNFAFAAVTAGTNGAQANIVGFNQLYSGTGTPFCAGLTFPEFIFSYASGVGPVATSPTLSLDGTQIAFVENDPNIGAVLHVMNPGNGSTEYGTCSNTGTAAPTCAIQPVIPGMTAGSTGTDYMVPLGLIATGIDSFSSPFVNYANDTLYVGDNNGILYSISPTFLGTPAQVTTGFPVTVHSTFALSSPVVDVSGTGDIIVGDSDNELWNFKSTGVAAAAALPVGGTGDTNSTAHGVRDAPVIDSTNSVGYVAAGCNKTDSVLQQFSFSTTTLASKAIATLDAEGCSGPAQLYAPTVDNNYFSKGISSAIAANNGEVQVCYAHSGHIAVDQFQFTSGTMGTTAQFDDEFLGSGGAFECSPLVELYSSPAVAITAVTQATTTVTVTAANTYAANDVVDINGITSGTGNCTATPAADIGGLHTVLTATGTSFTYTAADSVTITSGSCTLTSAASTLSGYAITGLTQTGTTVSVTTPTNAFANGQVVTIAGVAADGGGCSSAAAAGIDGEQTLTGSGTTFTFTSPVSATITSGNCTLTGSSATGPTQDYLYFSTNFTTPEAYTFTLPITGTAQAATATNTTSVTGGTSGMAVDNVSASGQAASLYFGTLATSTTVCGGTSAFCAVKLTQSALQ